MAKPRQADPAPKAEQVTHSTPEDKVAHLLRASSTTEENQFGGHASGTDAPSLSARPDTDEASDGSAGAWAKMKERRKDRTRVYESAATERRATESEAVSMAPGGKR